MSQTKRYNGKDYLFDDQGFLKDRHDWDEALAEALAAEDHLTLTDDHWKVIHFLRQYQQDYARSPAMRVMIKALREVIGPDKANSQNLYALFPYGPAKQASRYAGLPKPPHCL